MGTQIRGYCPAECAMTTKRKRYTRVFKLKAIRLLEEGCKLPAELARELDINCNQLYMWQEQLQVRVIALFLVSATRLHWMPSWTDSNVRTSG